MTTNTPNVMDDKDPIQRALNHAVRHSEIQKMIENLYQMLYDEYAITGVKFDADAIFKYQRKIFDMRLIGRTLNGKH